MSKVYPDAKSALQGLLKDDITIAAGGFGLCGIPENLIQALYARGTKNLTVISNNAGVDDFGIGVLLKARQVKKMISTYVGENKEFERQFLMKEIEVDLVPQGTFSERIRAAGVDAPVLAGLADVVAGPVSSDRWIASLAGPRPAAPRRAHA